MSTCLGCGEERDLHVKDYVCSKCFNEDLERRGVKIVPLEQFRVADGYPHPDSLKDLYVTSSLDGVLVRDLEPDDAGEGEGDEEEEGGPS